MLKSIAFVGGIHGVGKSTICEEICASTGLIYLSASEVLKWKEINTDESNKKVINVNYTQNRLAAGLNLVVKPQFKYLLDGHFCLFTTSGTIEKIPIETFELINPFSLNIIVDETARVKARLEKRDNKTYDIAMLEKIQNMEVNYANELSNMLNIKLNVGTLEDISQIINNLKLTL